MIQGMMLFRNHKNQSPPYSARFIPRLGQPQAFSEKTFEDEASLRVYLTDLIDPSLPLGRRQYHANQYMLELKAKNSISLDSIALTEDQFGPYR
jgi:hypothetical protein